MSSTDIYEGSDKHKKIVQKMSRQSENKECADCTGKGPSWASWNLGVFICIKCAGIHRKLGTHISQVRSTTLDKWALHQVQNMERIGGNIRANDFYEYSKPEKIRKPTENDDHYTKEKYIRNKYEKKLWARKDGEPLQRETNGAAAETPKRTEENTANGTSSSSNGSGNPMRRSQLSSAATSRRTKSTSGEERPSLIDFGDSSTNGNAKKGSDGLEQLLSGGSRPQQQQPVRNAAPQQQQQPVRNGMPPQPRMMPPQQQNGWDQNLLIDESQERSKHKDSIMGLFDQPQMAPQPQQRRFVPPMQQPPHMGGYPQHRPNGMSPMMRGPMGYPPQQPPMMMQQQPPMGYPQPRYSMPPQHMQQPMMYQHTAPQQYRR